MIYEENQMLLCCGFSIIANEVIIKISFDLDDTLFVSLESFKIEKAIDDKKYIYTIEGEQVMDLYIKREDEKISLQEWLDYVKTDKDLALQEVAEAKLFGKLNSLSK